MNKFQTEVDQAGCRERAYATWNDAICDAAWDTATEIVAENAGRAAWYGAIARDYEASDHCDFDYAATAAWDAAVRAVEDYADTGEAA